MMNDRVKCTASNRTEIQFVKAYRERLFTIAVFLLLGLLVITSEAPVFPLRPAQRTAETPTLPENRRLGSASGASLRRSDAEVQVGQPNPSLGLLL